MYVAEAPGGNTLSSRGRVQPQAADDDDEDVAVGRPGQLSVVGRTERHGGVVRSRVALVLDRRGHSQRVVRRRWVGRIRDLQRQVRRGACAACADGREQQHARQRDCEDPHPAGCPLADHPISVIHRVRLSTANRRVKASSDRFRPSWTCSSTRASSSSPAMASPSPRGKPATTRRRGGRRRRRDRLPVRRQGAGQDRRPRQGRRHQGRHRTPTRPRARRRDPRAWTSAASPSTRSGSRPPRRSRTSTTRRSSSTARPRSRSSCSRRKGGMDIEEVAEQRPGRDRHAARRPAARLPGLPRPPARLRGRRRRRRRAAGRRVPAPSSTTRSSPRRRCSSRSTR